MNWRESITNALQSAYANADTAVVEDRSKDMVGHTLGSILSLPQRVIDANQQAYERGDVFDPATTVEAAMTTMGTGAFAGVPRAVGETVLGAGVARDPKLWSPISETKLSKPISEFEHGYTDVRVPTPKIVDPSELVGGYGIFPPYDLSRANRTLTHVDTIPLQRPVRAHGGVGFSEANPGLAAASDLSIARRLDNQAAELTEKTGKPVYIMPMTMSATGIDASHHVADPLSQMVQMAKITKNDAKAFNTMMKEQVPDWVSFNKEKFPDYIANLEGGMKTKALMANRMALAEWQNKGFPNVAAIRHAMSEPGLIDMPRNTTGMAISRYTPGQGLLDTTHPSYRYGVAGQHMGQLAELLPFDVAATDIAKGLAEVNARNFAAGKTTAIQPAYHMGKPTPGVPTVQEFDEKWLEGVMKRLGR